jgi:hypothetical protein
MFLFHENYAEVKKETAEQQRQWPRQGIYAEHYDTQTQRNKKWNLTKVPGKGWEILGRGIQKTWFEEEIRL